MEKKKANITHEHGWHLHADPFSGDLELHTPWRDPGRLLLSTKDALALHRLLAQACGNTECGCWQAGFTQGLETEREPVGK